jgi:class 3 adenylate cyclase/tetratricopeptide (TPR) repeat protein
MDPNLSKDLRYVSGALAQWSHLTEAECSPPSVERLEGIFLFVDISGFTSVAARLSREGGKGLERISEILTEFFSHLVTLIERDGGVVFGFEGDALMAGWQRDAEGLSSPLRDCCACALEIQWRFGSWNANGQNLKLRMSIGAGEVELIHLGDQARRCYFLPAGEAVEQATSLVAFADPNEILVSREAWPLIQDCCEADVHNNGAMRLLRLNGTLLKDKVPSERERTGPRRNLSHYLPRALRARLNSSLPDWVGELRVVTITFVKILFGTTKLPLPDLNELFLKVERNVDCLGGEVLEVFMKREGLEVLCVFGLPTEAVEDMGKRAILATMNINEELSSKGFNVSAGIATGQVFCGPIGPEHRRQYSVVGAAVYLASRMLSVAAGRILVDESTEISTLREVRFDGPWPLHLAGIRDSVKSFVPLGLFEKISCSQPPELINREDEIEVLRTMLEQAMGTPRVVVVNGEAGVGKTALLSAFADHCSLDGVQTLQSSADAIDQVTPYLAWRSIIVQCLGLDSSESNASKKKEAVEKHLAKNQDVAALAPLLNDVLDLELTENWLTSNMAHDVRAENLKRLLTSIVAQRLEGKQSVIVLEDAQWMDESSWRLLIDLIRLGPKALIVISCRNLDAIQSFRRSGLQQINHHRLDLKRLSNADTIELVRKRLNQRTISDRLARLIIDTTEGNPFFVDEICHFLKQESISTDTNVTDQDYAIRLPKALETAVLSRIDHLSMDDQSLVKLASVVGTNFDLDMLKAVTPKGLDVANSINSLLAQQLFKPFPGVIEGFSFRHQIIRDLVYNSLLTGQKQEVHAGLAQFLESESVSADAVRLPRVLYHWRCANNPKKIVAYLDQVAALRLRQFDNSTAIKLLNECLSRAREQGIELGREKHAVCKLLLGEAYVGNGRMANARKSYEEGLLLLGQALPKGTFRLRVSLLGQALRQCRTRLSGPPSTKNVAPALETKPAWRAFYMAAQAYEDLTRIYYLGGEKARLLHAVLKATNLAEDLRECTPALAMNYATLGAICGVIPLRSQAEHYLQRASKVAKLYGEPSVSATVHLTSGLYRTSIADWTQAKASFLSGLDAAKTIGDKRRWCELAICLETISGPWLLTPAFSGIQAWDKLLEELASIGQDRADSHIVGCTVLANLRGNRVLGRTAHIQDGIEALKELLSSETCELELIHRVEGCAHLAGAEFEKGNFGAGTDWLQECDGLLSKLNPGMKVRTLPALSFLFDACLHQTSLARAEKKNSAQMDLALRTLRKLTHFARIYPIGRPEKLRCKGDLCAISGRSRKAAGLWRESLRCATRLKMALPAVQATERLRRAGQNDALVGPQALPDLLHADTWHPDVRDIAERALYHGSIDYLTFSGVATKTSRESEAL